MKKTFRFLRAAAAFLAASVMCTVCLSGGTAFAAGKSSLKQKDFVHAEGTKIVGTDGKELMIKGMALGNDVWNNPKTAPANHHSEQTYKELSKMGFNSVRFYLNYKLFEDDSAPYKYRKEGFEWLDKNIKWAKKYGIGIIFNMHYPQGGYQSNGDGMDLWTKKENQDRLTALWKSIAKRYANEPTVWGYGLVNEPVVPMLESASKTSAQYFSLVKRITKEIRKVSPYQMIFVEQLCAAKDIATGSADWEMFSEQNGYPKLTDKNIVYEFHYYKPHLFTHQNAEWSGNGGIFNTYPSDTLNEIEYENVWVSCESAVKKSADGDWTYFESRPVSMDSTKNVACAALNTHTEGKNGRVLFDDIKVTEISPSGAKKVIYTYDFSSSASDFYPWSSDGTGEFTYVADQGHLGKGCASIKGACEDFTASGDRFVMKSGYKYTVSGYMKGDIDKASIRLDFAKASKIVKMDKSYIDAGIKKYADYSEKCGRPVYLGEFGVIRYGFEENRNGEGWVSDVINICRKYGIGFNYHTYHEGSFGLYRNDQYQPPADRNEALYKVLKKELKKIK